MHITISLTAPRTKVKGGLFLDVIIGENPAVLELLSSENEALLIRGNSFLVLDFGLDVIDGVGRLDLQGDGLSGKGFHKDLHGYSTGRYVETMRQETAGEVKNLLGVELRRWRWSRKNESIKRRRG